MEFLHDDIVDERVFENLKPITQGSLGMGRIIAKSLLAAVILLAAWACVHYEVSAYFELDHLRSRYEQFQAFYQDHRVTTLVLFSVVYIASCAVSLPWALVFTLAAGALFGLVLGSLVIAIASAIGATLAFWTSRFLLRDFVEKYFGNRLHAIRAGVEAEGALYLLTLRLLPIFPFVVVNLVMGLTPMRTRTYFWVSLVGMLPSTIVYVNAGTQLSRLDSMEHILSSPLLAAFVLLGALPFGAKLLIHLLKSRRSLVRG